MGEKKALIAGERPEYVPSEGSKEPRWVRLAVNWGGAVVLLYIICAAWF